MTLDHYCGLVHNARLAGLAKEALETLISIDLKALTIFVLRERDVLDMDYKSVVIL